MLLLLLLLLLLSGTEDYLKEAQRYLDDKEVYEQVPDDLSALTNTLFKALEKIRLGWDLLKDTLDFLVKEPNFARFCLLPKIHKQLHDAPGSLVISHCSYYNEDISSFFMSSLATTRSKSQIRY